MPSVNRAGVDVCSGHGSFPPRPTASGSPNVFANSSAVMRQGDPYTAHGSPTPSIPHGGSESGGSGSVMVNGLPINRIGDPVSCGSVNATGSPDVFAGG